MEYIVLIYIIGLIGLGYGVYIAIKEQYDFLKKQETE